METEQRAPDESGDPDGARPFRIPTWLGLLLIVLAVVLAGALGLLLERLTAPSLP